MYKVVLVLVWLKEVKEVVVVTVETDCHLAPEMFKVDIHYIMRYITYKRYN